MTRTFDDWIMDGERTVASFAQSAITDQPQPVSTPIRHPNPNAWPEHVRDEMERIRNDG